MTEKDDLKNFYNGENEIKKIRDSLDSLSNCIRFKQDYIDELLRKDEKKVEYHRFKVVRYMIRLITSGYDETSALHQVQMLYYKSMSPRLIDLIWKTAKSQRGALELFSRTYMVKKMRLAGFSLSQISKTMNISVTSVQKLLKQDCNILKY